MTQTDDLLPISVLMLFDIKEILHPDTSRFVNFKIVGRWFWVLILPTSSNNPVRMIGSGFYFRRRIY
jgi:hypothetical protein